MCRIGEMMKRVKTLDTQKLAADTMVETRQDFKQWQQEQLFAGKRKDTRDISPFYAPATVRQRRKKGLPTDRVTLKVTGFFYDSIYLVVKRQERTFSGFSSDPKSKWILQRYGDKIMGLGGVFKKGYVSDLRPVYMGKIRKHMKL